MKKFGIALLAVLAVNSAVGANWVQLGGNSDMTTYLDIQSVKAMNNSNQEITYFIKHDFKTATKLPTGKYYNYIILQNKGNCSKDMYDITALIHYSRSGNVINTSDYYSVVDLKPVFPDTIAEAELHSACYIAGYRSEI